MRKKFLTVMLIGAMTMSTITGCSSKTGTDKVTEAPTVETPTIEEPTTEAPGIEEPTAQPEPTEEVTPVTEPDDEPEEDSVITKIEQSGSVDGETYTNSMIGFSITYPENWVLYSSDDTYKFIAVNAGMTEDYATTLKSQTQMQGVSYLSYGSDTQLNDVQTANNLMAQGMTGALFDSMKDDQLLTTMCDTLEKQYTSKGGSCTIQPTETTTIDDQQVYTISAAISVQATTGDMVNLNQEYIAFRRNGVFVFMALSVAPSEKDEIRQLILDNMSFQ